MKLIILSPFPYHSRVAHGGGHLCYEQLLRLAQSHEVHFLSFDGTESESGMRHATEELGSICRSVEMLPMELSRSRVWKAKLEFLLRGEPIEAILYRSPEMERALARMIEDVRPDVVMVQFPQMAQYVNSCSDAATILDVQDALSITSFRKFSAAPLSLRKLLLFVRWLSWLNYEIRNYRRFDAVATLTEQDRIGLEIFSPGLGASRTPAAVTPPAEYWTAANMEADSIGYICSFGHEQNIEALMFFVRVILPAIIRRRPNARLVIAGDRPPANMLALASNQVRFEGFVDDVDTFLRARNVVVVPLLSGGGIKIKTLKAMACGCPVVATSIGVEEIGAQDGVHAAIADDPEQFATKVGDLLEDAELAARLGANGKALIALGFSWPGKMATLNAIFTNAQRRHRKRCAKRATTSLSASPVRNAA